MNKSTILAIAFVVCALMLVVTQPLRAQAPTPAPASRTIATTGDAEVKVAPDQVVLILGVETWDKDIQVSKKQNDDRVQKVIVMAENQGVDPKNIQTDQIHVEPRYHDYTYADADFIGYFIDKTIVITLQDISKFEAVYTAALRAGANHVYAIQFQTTELRKYRDQARALAIQAAQEKAGALAGTLGQKIGEAQSIQENYSGWNAWYATPWGSSTSMSQNVVQNVSSGAVSQDGTFAPGQISVTARVSVTFDLQ